MSTEYETIKIIRCDNRNAFNDECKERATEVCNECGGDFCHAHIYTGRVNGIWGTYCGMCFK